MLFSRATAAPTTESAVVRTGGSTAATTGGGGALSSSRGLADRVQVRTAEVGWVVGVAVWMLGFL